MTAKEADKIIEKINDLVRTIEYDEELKLIDRRYSVAASWCDVDIETVSI